jgi:uncharacterized protein DUF3105
LPLPALALLTVLLAGGALALIVGAGARKSARLPSVPLADVAREAGCHVSEFDGEDQRNPPVAGRFMERDRAADGSYAGRRSPSLAAVIHALYHGRVLVQYRPDLPKRQIDELDRLVSSDSDKVLLFANQTGMRAPLAATSYLSLMTCQKVDSRTLHALRVYRDRRRGFGQGF